MIINWGDTQLFNTADWKLPFIPFGKEKNQDKPDPGLLPETGRSSVEVGVNTFSSTLHSLASYYDIVNPEFPVELYKYITLLSVINPDLSQTASNFQNISNTGHKLILVDQNSNLIDTALDELNQKAYEWYKISAGVDGLIGHYMNQLIVSGAVSSEDVLEPDLTGVRKIVIVPTYSIRFRYIDGEYMPFQQPDSIVNQKGDFLIPLNNETYTIYALNTINNSPYPVPPFISALEPITWQRDAFDSIRLGLKKIGLLGLNIVKVKPLKPEPGESDSDYVKRNQAYLKQVSQSIGNNFNKGIVVIPDSHEYKNFGLTANFTGAKDFLQIIEELLFSGAKTHSAFHGRPYSTTETYSTVIYNMLISMAANIRRLVKRRHEKTIRLHLKLTGMLPEVCSLIFNKDKRLDPNNEALARRQDQRNILELAQAGAISLQTAAQELGLNEWYDETLFEMMTQKGLELKQFAWSDAAQRYVHIRNLIDLDRQFKNERRTIRLKDEQKEKEVAEKAEKQIQKLTEDFLRESLPYFDQLESDVSEFAVNFLADNIDKVEKDVYVLVDAVKQYIKGHDDYKNIDTEESWFKEEEETFVQDVAKYFKEDDLTVFSFGDEKPDFEFRFSEGDQVAADNFKKIGQYYFSKFIDNKDFGADIRTYVTTLLERGESDFYGLTDEAKKEFLRKFGRAFKRDVDFQMRRITASTLSRMRVYGHLSQLHDVDFQFAEVVSVLDMNRCDICAGMHGKKIPVGKAYDLMSSLFDAEELEDIITFFESSNVGADDLDKTIDDLIKEGKGIPPFHVLCRCILKALFT